MKPTPRILTTLICGAAIAVAAFPLAISAAPMVPGGGRLAHGIVERVLDDPEIREQASITDEQAEAIESAMFESREEMIRNRSEAELARLELERLWAAEEPDAEAIHEAIDRLGEIHTAQQHAAADLRLEVNATLSQEQRDAIREFVRDRRQERRDERGDRRGALRDGLRQHLRGAGPAGGPDQGPSDRVGPPPRGQGPGGPFAGFGPDGDPFAESLAGGPPPQD